MTHASPTNEKALVLLLIEGDKDAFCELYATYRHRLIYFTMKFVKSRDFAEDIFQDAFTVVWQSRRFINPEMPFSSYLYTIVRNRILNQMRDLGNEEELKDHILSQAIDATHDTEEQVIFEDLKKIVGKALESLTPRQREIFEMSRNLSMSHKEIADAMDISVPAVQKHISTALKVIRSYLTKYAGLQADLLLILYCLNT